MMRNKKGILLIGLLFLPMLMMASGGDWSQENYVKAVEFLQGDGVLESWFTEGFLPQIQGWGFEHYNKYILFAQSIAGITGLIYMGNKGWGMLSGDKPWEVLPLLRPLVFALILANWVPLTMGVQQPFRYLSNSARGEFNSMQNDLLGERVNRFKAQNMLLDAIMDARTETAQAQQAIEGEAEGGGWFGWGNIVGGAVDDMANYIMAMGLKLQFNMQIAFANILEIVGLLILRLIAYGILFIQQIMILFLIIIGPFSFGFSILPVFRSAWIGWFSKFIGVQFYSVITYVILQMGVMLQLSAVRSELDRYAQLINLDTGEILDLNLLVVFGTSGVMTFGMLLLAYLLTAVGLLMVPTLSSYVLGSASSTGGITSKGGALAGAAVGKVI